MNWYYQEGDKAAGPVTAEALRDLRHSGVLQRDTLVWQTGMANWQPYHKLFPEAEGAAVPPPLSGTVEDPGLFQCAECLHGFPREELVEIQGQLICGGCKARVVQMLREGLTVGASHGWQDGDKLVVKDHAELPSRCIKCGSTEDLRTKKRTIFWHPTWLYLLLLVNLLILIIVYLIVRKKGVLTYSVCARHRSQLLIAQLIAWALSLGGLAVIFLAFFESSAAIGILGAAVALAGLVLAVLRGSLFTVSKIKDGNIWLKGTDPQQLRNLPEWPG